MSSDNPSILPLYSTCTCTCVAVYDIVMCDVILIMNTGQSHISSAVLSNSQWCITGTVYIGKLNCISQLMNTGQSHISSAVLSNSLHAYSANSI